MTRDEVHQRAVQADRLLRDEWLMAFLDECRADCLSDFENSGPEDTGTREEAHGLLRAITKLKQKLSAVKAAEAVEAKRDKRKDQHRV